jgi:hypothetical protein
VVCVYPFISLLKSSNKAWNEPTNNKTGKHLLKCVNFKFSNATWTNVMGI